MPGLAIAGLRAEVHALRERLEAPLTVSPTAPPVEPPPPEETWISTVEAARRANLSRDTLDRMVERAPRGLPGAPVPAGVGRKRHHWRWDPDRLPEWLAAYQAWDEQDRVRHPRARMFGGKGRVPPRGGRRTVTRSRSGRAGE